MTSIKLMDDNDIKELPKDLRRILEKYNIEVWKESNFGVAFIPLCRVMDILVQYEEMTAAVLKIKAEVKDLERYRFWDEEMPLVNVDKVMQICDKYNATD